MFGTTNAISAAKALLHLRMEFSNPPKNERQLDPLFYAYLKGRHSTIKVSRQVHVHFVNKSHPSRVDFRLGGSNPTLLELAVRPPGGFQELMGPQNKKELRKLSKFPQTKAKRRILLLLDLRETPLHKVNLKASYASVHAGPGKKGRHAVTVVYVHARTDYWFSWDPFKK
jgi:hypothetical protein